VRISAQGVHARVLTGKHENQRYSYRLGWQRKSCTLSHLANKIQPEGLGMKIRKLVRMVVAWISAVLSVGLPIGESNGLRIRD